MGFSRQEYWSGLPFYSPGDLPDAGIEPGSPALQADSLSFELQGSPYKYKYNINNAKYFQLFGDAIFIKTNRLIYSLNYTGRVS